MFKRMLCLLLLLTLTGVPCNAASVPENAQAVLNDLTVPTLSNMRIISAAPSEILSQSGGKGWVLNPTEDNSDILIDLDDNFSKYISKDKIIEVTITYLDKDSGTFGLLYDSYDNPNKWAGNVKVGSSGKWITTTFNLESAKFGNGLENGDLKIVSNHTLSKNSNKNIVISKIEVNYSERTNPVRTEISTEKTGNIFFEGEVPEFDISCMNVSGAVQTLRMKVYAKDDSNEIVYQDEEVKTFTIDENYKRTLAIPDIGYGVFTLFVEITDNSNANVLSKADKEFSHIRTRFGENLDDTLGFSVHFSQPGYYVDETHRLTVNAGVGNLRDSFGWSEYETKSVGNYVFRPLWQNMLDKANKSSQQYLLILGSDQRWLYPNQKDDIYIATEESRNQFKVYIKKLVEQVGDSVKYFEVWNEYNTKNHDANAYYEMLKASYEAVKEVKSDAVVVGGALANEYSLEDRCYTVPYDFLEQLLKLGAGKYMDVLSIHPYVVPDSPETGDIRGRCEKTRTLIDKYNPSIKLWASEFGWHTMDNFNTEEEQSKYSVRALIMNKAYKFMDKMFFYTFQDATCNRYYSEDCWGLIRSSADKYDGQKNPNAAKPIYASMSNVNYLLSEATLESDLSEQSSGVYIYKFKNASGKAVYAMWKESGVETVSVQADNNSMILCDIYGNESIVESVGGKYNINISERPVYLYEDESGAEYNKTEGLLKVSGYVPSMQSDVNVSIKVMYPNGYKHNIGASVLDNVMYFDQTKSDSNGRYGFSINPGIVNGKYKIYISTDDSDTSYEYEYTFVDTQPNVAYNKTLNGDKLNLKVTITNLNSDLYSEIHPILAVYDKNENMVFCNYANLLISQGNSKMEYEFSVPFNNKENSAKVFVWDEKMQPISIEYDTNN